LWSIEVSLLPHHIFDKGHLAFVYKQQQFTCLRKVRVAVIQ
jgi:hypothetical protein